MRRFASSLLSGSALVLALGLLSLQPSEARIVYTQTNETISGPDKSLAIDLNHDGVTDVTIFQNMATSGCYFDYVVAEPAAGDAIVSNYQYLDGFWASALMAGQFVGPGSPFTSSNAVMTDVYGGFGCPFSHDYGYWGNSGPHYLGIAFVKNGKVRFAWAQLQVSFGNSQRSRAINTTLTGYAYQTIVGKGIPAGRT